MRTAADIATNNTSYLASVGVASQHPGYRSVIEAVDVIYAWDKVRGVSAALIIYSHKEISRSSGLKSGTIRPADVCARQDARRATTQ